MTERTVFLFPVTPLVECGRMTGAILLGVINSNLITLRLKAPL